MDYNQFFDSINYEAIATFGDKSFPKGAEKDDDGRALQAFRHLPHHKKSATDPNDHDTVDIPHLRNALARVNQVKPQKEAAEAFRTRAQKHLNRHAKALLKTRKEGARFLAKLCNEFGVNISTED